MRVLYTLLFTASCFAAAAQSTAGFSYSLSVPQQKMADNINPLHSLAGEILFHLPGAWKRVQLGAEGEWGMYANSRKKQTFRFNNGSSTETWVEYNSNVIQGSLIGRVSLLNDKKVLPYLSGKLGYASFYSNIYIEDPHDPGGCTPLDRKNIIKDGTFITGWGGGLQVDWALFSQKTRRGRTWVDLRAQQVNGGKINYINTKKLIDADNPPPPGNEGKPLNVTFINASTNEIHEHQVAEVYTTPLRMLEFKLSAVFVLD